MLLTFFFLFHPTGINSVLSRTLLTGLGPCLLSLVPFWISHPPGIISLSFSSSSQHGQNHIGCCSPPSPYSIHQESFLSPPWRIQQGLDDICWRWLPSQFFIPQESSLSLTWTMPFPPSSRRLLFPLPRFITGLWTGDLSVISFTGTCTEI